MNAPWSCTDALDPAVRAEIREHMALDHCKWDPQVGDVSVLAPYAILLDDHAWREIASSAESLASEALNAERELLTRPDLAGKLALPRALLRHMDAGVATGTRIIRFDFHLTPEGWRISEANTDVPGGLIEAGPFCSVMAHALGARADLPPDPSRALAESIIQSPDATIALVHASAYTDDRQVMVHLARAIERSGGRPLLVAPDQLQWLDRRAHAHMGPNPPIPVDAIIRFFPAEWLPNLPARCWRGFMSTRTRSTNPPSALLIQSKRLPLIWNHLDTPMPTWRALLPETRDPRRVSHRDPAWILKPALGRVGAGVAIANVTPDRALRAARRSSRRFPRHWIAQRRFDALPLSTPEGDRYPCLGVYVIAGRAAGIYGRLAPRPLIDSAAQDVAVLLSAPQPISASQPKPPRRPVDGRSTRTVPSMGP